MCLYCDRMAPRCAYTYGAYFEKICYKNAPRRSEAFHVKVTKQEWPDLFPAAKGDGLQQSKQPSPTTPPPRLAILRTDATHVETEIQSSKMAPAVKWYDTKPGVPNESEVLFFSLLVAKRASTAVEAEEWAKNILKLDEPIRSSPIWPPPGVPELQWKGSRAPSHLKLLHDAYGSSWTKEDLEQIVKAMLAFKGPGRFEAGRLQFHHLRSYKDANLRGPPQGTKGKAPPRFCCASVLDVAALVKRECRQLRQLLKLDIPVDEVPTIAMDLENMMKEANTLRTAFKSQGIKLQTTHAELCKVKDAHRQAMRRAQDIRKAKRDAREAERQKLATRVAACRQRMRARMSALKTQRMTAFKEARLRGKQQGEEAASAELERRRAQVSTARKRARDSEYAASQSKKRLLRAQYAEGQVKELSAQIEEYRAHYSSALNAKQEAEVVLGKFSMMPTWRPVRGKGRGRGRSAIDWRHTVSIWELLTLGVPASAVGKTIVSIVKRTAPWLEPVEPTVPTIRESRFALRTGEEAMAARRAAASFRVRQLGPAHECRRLSSRRREQSSLQKSFVPLQRRSE
ncbi:hypothetical protein AB1Y20_005231 [Prymnesium parvum]|uniref:Uncharacterized protein n=1 Tax=Prymnesium parvum TaxID=97485 RepID=A0AB34J408_PRYPA